MSEDGLRLDRQATERKMDMYVRSGNAKTVRGKERI